MLIHAVCLFGAHLLTVSALSKTELRAAGRRADKCRACVTHKAFSHNCHLFQLLAFCLGAPFSFTQKTALSSYISHFRSLVFCVWKPCVCSTSDCAVLLRSRRTKRSGIISERYLFMRVPLSPPRAMFTLVGKCPYTSGGRDALSNTFGECVVAKANEADCGAQTPKWTCRRVRKEGVIHFKELRRTLYIINNY